MVLAIAGFHPRSFSVKILFLGTAFTFIVFLHLSSGHSTFSSIISLNAPTYGFETKSRTCPPRAYANGQWTGPHYRTDARNMMNKSQALGFAGFEGCASSREFDWDTEKQWDWFPEAQSYLWTVGKEDGCDVPLELDKEQMVRDLVQQGGGCWSGILSRKATSFRFHAPYSPMSSRAKVYPEFVLWPQGLYLNPESPLLRPSSGMHRQLRIPLGFIITSTPLVTFRRIDLLFRQKDLEHFSLFSEKFSIYINFIERHGSWQTCLLYSKPSK